MTGGAGRRRVFLLFSVLAGLFLMHGLSGGDSCHGMPPAAMSAMPAMPSEHGAYVHPVAHDMTVMAVPSHRMPGHPQIGDTCVPLRPEGSAGLFLALILVVVTVWWPRLPHGTTLIRPHWPHGPPRTGAQILRTLSLSRT